MKEWPKYFLHFSSKNEYGYWKFSSSRDTGKYFYRHLLAGHNGTEKSVWSLQYINKEGFKQISEEELTLLLLEQ